MDDHDLDLAIALSLSESSQIKHSTRGANRPPINARDEHLASRSVEFYDNDLALAISLSEELNAKESTIKPTSSSTPHISSSSSGGTRGSTKQDSKHIASKPRESPSPLKDSKPGNTLMGLFNTRLGGCHACNKACAFSAITVGSLIFHPECFSCAGCNKQITGSFVTHEDSYYHPDCHIELFAKKCSVCCHAINGKYMKHPFFAEEAYCFAHESIQKSCFSCSRREPLSQTGKDGFAELPDGRSICPSCVCTVTMDSAEAKPIYLDCVAFLRDILGLRIPPGMENVPILAVDIPSLNSQLVNGKTAHKSNVTRGMTLSTRGEISHMSGGSIAWDPVTGRFLSLGQPQVHKITEVRDVTCVLVLFGLPRDLTASILAHEAFHVWIKLTNDMPFNLPPNVEEGMCQLVSSKYLEHLQNRYSPSQIASSKERRTYNDLEVLQRDSRLRKYFQFCIETDTTPIYGEGFREAAKVCSELPLEDVLDYIKQYKEFPKM